MILIIYVDARPALFLNSMTEVGWINPIGCVTEVVVALFVSVYHISYSYKYYMSCWERFTSSYAMHIWVMKYNYSEVSMEEIDRELLSPSEEDIPESKVVIPKYIELRQRWKRAFVELLEVSNSPKLNY